MPLLLDSGIRSGADVVKGLAAGVQLCLLGRATLYGLTADGDAGVCEVIEMNASEIDTTLALTGYPRMSDIGSEALLVE